jgi:hypothetical protein
MTGIAADDPRTRAAPWWRHTRKPPNNLYLNSHRLAQVVNDHLGGSYQRMSWEATAGSATSPPTLPLTSAITGATFSSAWCQGGNPWTAG